VADFALCGVFSRRDEELALPCDRTSGDVAFCSATDDGTSRCVPDCLELIEEPPSRDPVSEPMEDCELGRRAINGLRFDAEEDATNFFVALGGFFLSDFVGDRLAGGFVNTVVFAVDPDETSPPSLDPSFSSSSSSSSSSSAASSSSDS
jgi:hypothetical protein